MASNISVLDLDIKNTLDDNDSVIMVIGGKVSRFKISTLKSILKQWNDIINKPFDNISANSFEINNGILSLSSDIINELHTHQNKTCLDKIGENDTGEITYDGNVISPYWNNVSDKPFSGLSSDFTVTDDIISISTDVKHIHTNKNVIDKFSESEGTLLYDGQEIGAGSGIDFTALSNALTGGTLTNISIVADSETETFNITVRDVPTIAIDANGDWTIDGVSTGQSSKGENGATPTINESDKHWYIDGVDTGVIAEGQDGQNGQNGFTPTIDSTTKHWMIGEIDTNVTAEAQDGFSPSIVLTPVSNGVEIGIVNKNSTETATITNGITTVQSDKVDLTCTLLAERWSNTLPYTQTVEVLGVTSDLNPRIDVLISDNLITGNREIESWSCITKAITETNSMTFYCYKLKPTVDLNVMIEVI